jgi:hypothetical protein
MHGALAVHVDAKRDHTLHTHRPQPTAVPCRLAVPSSSIVHGRESPADVAPAAATMAN